MVAAIIAVIISIVISTDSRENATAPQAALPDDTALGVVELRVHELPAMQSYYEQAVGLAVLEQNEGEVILGIDAPLLRLVADTSGEALSTPTEAGLYHSAILYPDEASLAATLMSIASVAPESYQGSADHAVSLAFYFVDPEGNGLELYVDRPEDVWVWENGEVRMGSAPLDVNEFVQNHLPRSADAPAVETAEMGHVHLKVGDLEQARTFYADALGFAVTAESDGALFYSAGGYHHHLATNVWQSAGAGERANSTGLGSIVITVADAAVLDEVAARLVAGGYDSDRVDGALVTVDPWGNTVIVVVERG